MKSIVLLSIAFLIGIPQDDTPEERLKKKLESPFLKKIEWVRDFDEAKAAARKSGRLIFAYFTVTGP